MKGSYKNYGLWMFCKIEDGIEGLIHNSELDWTNRNIKPSKVLSVLKILNLKL